MKILDLSYLKNHPTERGYTIKEIFEEALSESFAKSLGNVEVLNVEKKYVDEVCKMAKEIGIIDYLSKNDLKLVALALKFKDKCILLTNDLCIQNLCYFLGIKFSGDQMIKKARIYRYHCDKCNKVHKLALCPDCGNICKRFVYKEIDLKTNQP